MTNPDKNIQAQLSMLIEQVDLLRQEHQRTSETCKRLRLAQDSEKSVAAARHQEILDHLENLEKKFANRSE